MSWPRTCSDFYAKPSESWDYRCLPLCSPGTTISMDSDSLCKFGLPSSREGRKQPPNTVDTVSMLGRGRTHTQTLAPSFLGRPLLCGPGTWSTPTHLASARPRPFRAEPEVFANQRRRGRAAGARQSPQFPKQQRSETRRRGAGLAGSARAPRPPSPPFAVFSFSARPELCDPGSSGAIAVWDKQ